MPNLLGKKFKIIYKDDEYEQNDTLSFGIGKDELVTITLDAQTSNVCRFSFCYYINLKTYALFKERLDIECKAELSDSDTQFSFKIENGKIFGMFNAIRKIYNYHGKRCYMEGISLTDWHELVEI